MTSNYKFFSLQAPTRLFLGVIVIATLISCTGNIVKRNPDQLVIFPPPPDTTRIQFLTSYSTSTDITGTRSGFEKLILGDDEPITIGKPYGIAVSKDKFYVCDTQLGGIEIFDLKNSSFKMFKPTGLGEFKKPVNCSIDTEGYLYIVDVDRKDIVIFDSELKYYKNFGLPELVKPTDVFVANDKIFVSDIKAGKIMIYSKSSLSLLNSFPETSAEDPSYLHQPTNISIIDDKIYVSDFGDFNIKVFDINGIYLRTIGSYGEQAGQFVRPKGIALDREENLFVVDAGFENVQIFNAEGKLLMHFGGSYTGPGYMYIPAKIAIDYLNLEYYAPFVDDHFILKYLIFVTNQFGPDKINVYGFVEPKK